MCEKHRDLMPTQGRSVQRQAWARPRLHCFKPRLLASKTMDVYPSGVNVGIRTSDVAIAIPIRSTAIDSEPIPAPDKGVKESKRSLNPWNRVIKSNRRLSKSEIIDFGHDNGASIVVRPANSGIIREGRQVNDFGLPGGTRDAECR